MRISNGPLEAGREEAAAVDLACWFPLVLPHLDRSLLEPVSLQSLTLVARRLPGTCTAALEVGITQPANGADLSIRLLQPAEAVALATQPFDPHLRALLRRWAASETLRSQIPALWLELDLTRRSKRSQEEELPQPVICARTASAVENRWIVDRLLPALHGVRALPAEQRRLAAETLAALPSSASLRYVFSLRSREPRSEETGEPAAVRLQVSGLEPEDLPRLLDRLPAPSGAPRLGVQIEEVMPLIQRAGRNHLSFDLGSTVRPRIGVELSFARLPKDEPGWAELLDLLAVRGLLGGTPEEAAAKRQAVLGWPGYDSFWTAAEVWPAAAGAGYCVRSLSHLKLVTWPDREPQAKVYFLFGLWRRSAGLGS